MEIIIKKRNIENVEERLKPIVMVLQDHEEVLSDGYKYYCEYFASEQADERHNGDLVVGALEEIARKIMDKIEETEPTVTLVAEVRKDEVREDVPRWLHFEYTEEWDGDLGMSVIERNDTD